MGKKGKAKKQVEQEQQKHQQEVTQKKQTQAQTKNQKEGQEQQKPKPEIAQPKKIQYCPICTFPFQLCKYGKKASQCKNFLMQIAPTKVSKYHPQGDSEIKHEQQDVKQKSQNPQEKKQNKKQKSVKDKYILIDVKQRQKKKFTTEISGLAIFAVQSKKLAKQLCKKFACSCSAGDNDKVTIQGDFFEDVREILINEYKVKKKYILDKDQYKQKVQQEKQKKKLEKNRDKNVIDQVPEKDQKDETKQQPKPQEPKFKNKMQQALANLDKQDQDDD